ncbi:hypothetical protein PABG_11554 [Paracoccidioides brasiliensis Pb03]|nr:hypothetical protein PABG_11554 [Paracoccidioides brasiliensis Pb03]
MECCKYISPRGNDRVRRGGEGEREKGSGREGGRERKWVAPDAGFKGGGGGQTRAARRNRLPGCGDKYREGTWAEGLRGVGEWWELGEKKTRSRIQDVAAIFHPAILSVILPNDGTTAVERN